MKKNMIQAIEFGEIKIMKIENNNKKYELTNESVQIDNKTLYRIRALRDIQGYVKAGDLGGFVQSENNLSHEGTCWIYNDACVYDHAHVSGNAKIYNKANISEHAKIMDYSTIHNEAYVTGHAIICGDSHVYNNVVITDQTFINNSRLYGNAHIHGKTSLSYCNVQDFIDISGKMGIYNANFGGEAKIQRLADYYLVQHPAQYGCMLTIYNGLDNKQYVFEDNTSEPILFSDFMSKLIKENRKYKSFERYINDYFSIREKEHYREPASWLVSSKSNKDETVIEFERLD